MRFDSLNIYEVEDAPLKGHESPAAQIEEGEISLPGEGGASLAAGAELPHADGLHLQALRLLSFRNCADVRLEDIGNLTILIGPNAVGKTSVIEAIQMMTDLKSFRTSRYGQMIRHGDDEAMVQANLVGNGRDLDVRLIIRNGKRSYNLNGKNKAVQNLKGLLPAVTFSPDDLNLAKGPNTSRRNAIDGLGSQLSKNFYSVKNDYAKLIKQRNRALKDGLPDAYIDSIDEILVRVGAQLMSHRMVILDKMRNPFVTFYHEISGGRERLDFAYLPSWVDADVDDIVEEPQQLDSERIDKDRFSKHLVMDAFVRALKQSRERERAYGKSLVGPHADKILFLLDGRNEIHYSSQGQQRSIVLAFKLAELAVIQETLHQKPILLLDDVMSELDEQRRAYFMNFISSDIQTFITTTNKDYFDPSIYEQANIVNLPFEEGPHHG